MCGGILTVIADSTPGVTQNTFFQSLSLLDCLYCSNHHFSIFKNCFLQPVGFSDHSLISYSVFIENIRLKSA